MSKRSRRDRRSKPAPESPALAAAEPEVDELASEFFSQPPSEPPGVELESVEHAPPRIPSPGAHARRERFTRYVKGFVGVCTALCVVAVVRVSLGKRRGEEPVRVVVVAAAPPPLEQKVAAAPPPPPAPVEIASAPAASVATPLAPVTVHDPAAARRELRTAQTALESRRLADAIAAGTRATAFDPTDGEAWLVLGAAFQEAGQLDDARRCYRACLSEGKRGPKSECAAMLRQ